MFRTRQFAGQSQGKRPLALFFKSDGQWPCKCVTKAWPIPLPSLVLTCAFPRAKGPRRFRREIFFESNPPPRNQPTLRPRDQHTVEACGHGRVRIGNRARVAVVDKAGAGERVPLPGGQARSEFDRVDVVGEARVEDQILVAGLAGDSFDAELEKRTWVRGDKAGGELERVRLAVAIGIETRRGERVVEAEVLHLPAVADAVAGVEAEVVRD